MEFIISTLELWFFLCTWVLTLLFAIYFYYRYRVFKRVSELVPLQEVSSSEMSQDEMMETVLMYIEYTVLPWFLRNDLVREKVKIDIIYNYILYEQYVKNNVKRLTGKDYKDIVEDYNFVDEDEYNSWQCRRDNLYYYFGISFCRFERIDGTLYPVFKTDLGGLVFVNSVYYRDLQNLCAKHHVSLITNTRYSKHTFIFYLRGEGHNVSKVLKITGMDQLIPENTDTDS